MIHAYSRTRHAPASHPGFHSRGSAEGRDPKPLHAQKPRPGFTSHDLMRVSPARLDRRPSSRHLNPTHTRPRVRSRNPKNTRRQSVYTHKRAAQHTAARPSCCPSMWDTRRSVDRRRRLRRRSRAGEIPRFAPGAKHLRSFPAASTKSDPVAPTLHHV